MRSTVALMRASLPGVRRCGWGALRSIGDGLGRDCGWTLHSTTIHRRFPSVDRIRMPRSRGNNPHPMTPRLRRSDCSSPGFTRRRAGRGFTYLDTAGERIDDEATLERIRELAIPPAWKDVWICPDERGHLQATGVDDAGRKQYRYHDRWRARRDAEKFEDMVDFARALPLMRKRVARAMRGDELSETRVLACSVRLLDLGFFRVGGETYAAENESFGLATIRREHVTIEDG